MRRFLILLLLTSTVAHAQPSDFIILKKKNKTIHSYYSGMQIEFVTATGAYRNALITNIHNDTVNLREFIVRQMVTKFGFYVTDTAGSYSYAYDYRDIKSIGKKQKGFDVRGSGAALLGGGAVLTLASGVVFLADRKKFSPALLGASAGLGIIGYFMSRSGSKGIVIGKKHYHIEYVNLSATTK